MAEGAAETQGSDIRAKVKKVFEPAGPPRDHQHSTAGQGPSSGNHTRGGGESGWVGVSVVTWDDREPARLVGCAYIIGDFTGILSSVLLGHVGEGEHLHV